MQKRYYEQPIEKLVETIDDMNKQIEIKKTLNFSADKAGISDENFLRREPGNQSEKLDTTDSIKTR